MDPNSTDVYIGTDTQPHRLLPDACGEDIVACTFDAKSGALKPRETMGEILNPSYLALDRTETYMLAASENLDAEGAVYGLRRLSGGGLEIAGTQPSGGIATCHVCAAPDDKVYISSYQDGALAAHSMCEGVIGPRKRLFRYAGVSVKETILVVHSLSLQTDIVLQDSRTEKHPALGEQVQRRQPGCSHH